MRGTAQSRKETETSALVVPSDLKGLALYETDSKLCGAWEKFKAAQSIACPGIDIVAQTRLAHAWEVANPTKRKKLRTRFLASWFARAQDRPGAGQYRQSGKMTREEIAKAVGERF